MYKSHTVVDTGTLVASTPHVLLLFFLQFYGVVLYLRNLH